MGHLNSHLLWSEYGKSYFKEGLKILEIGPAGYPTYFEKKLIEEGIKTDYQVLDITSDFISDAHQNPKFILANDPLNYPIENDFFDVVFSDQVLAHVSYFWKWYGELVRITKPGGHIITINSYSYPRCPSPIDAWRVHSEGMKILNDFYDLHTVLSTTESLEMKKYKIPAKPGYYYPSASIEKPFGGLSNKNLMINKIKNHWNAVVGRIPLLRAVLLNPVHISFDTITIARKN